MTTHPYRAHRPTRLGPALLLAWLVCSAGTARSATTITDFRLDGPDARFSLRSDPQAYYLVEWTTDLTRFNDLVMTLGTPAPNLAYRVLPMFPRLFFRGAPLDLCAPGDRDGDGIDDVYELKNLWLNPLDPSDAAKDPDGNGRSHLQEYRNLLGISADPPELYSREVSLYYGVPPIPDPPEVYSREVSLYYGTPPIPDIPEVYSREVSLYYGTPPIPDIPEVYSREVSLYNGPGGPPPTNIPEVYSREVSLYNGTGGPPPTNIPEVYSREVSLYNGTVPPPDIPEVSLLNDNSN